MKKFIFIDIDGTLFDYENARVPASAIEAIETADKNGHKLFLCTGRTLPEIDSSLFQLPFSGMILGAGSHVFIEGKEIYKQQIPYKYSKFLLDYMLKHKLGFMIEGATKNFFSPEAKELFEGMQNKTNSEFEIPMSDYKEMTEEDMHNIQKFSILTSNRNLGQELIDILPTELSGFIDVNDAFDSYSGEITMTGINKSSGIEKVLIHYNHPIDHTIGIGDSLNDLDMIEYVNVGISMGNGCKELKDIADYITKSVSDDGLAHAFKHLELV